MAERKNNYRGQYKVENGLDGSFESYWSRYGVESQDDSVRVLMHAIFDLLSQDIKKSQKSADYNQAIFDMVEMRDLQKALKQVLEQYSEIEESDLKMTTDVVRKRLQASIENEIKNVFDSVTKKLKEANAESEQANKESDTETKVQEQQKPSRGELEKKIRDILGQFFESKKRESKTEEKKPETIPSPKSKENKQENIQKEDVPGVKSQGANQDKIVKTEIVQEKTEPKKEKFEDDDLEKFSKALIREYWRGGNAAEKSSDPIFTKLGKKLRQKIATKGGLTKLLSKFTFGEQQKKSRRKGPFSKDKDNPLDSYSKLTGKLAKYMEKKEKNDKKRFKQKIQNGFKLLRASFAKALGFAFNMFKLVLTPIGNVMSGVWNTIRHPIQSLQKFLQSGVFGIIKATFSNPANAHLMGFILGFIYFRFIESPLLKYIINPIEVLHGEILDLRIKYAKEGPPPIVEKIINMFKDIKYFFEPVEGANFILGFVYRVAEKIGFSDLPSFARVIKFCSSKLGAFFYNGIQNIIKDGMFSHFQGAGLIQKMIMLAMAQQGEMQAEILSEADEHYEFKAAEKVRGPSIGEKNIGDSNLDNEEKEKAIDDYYKARKEVLDNLPRLNEFLKFLKGSSVEISEEDIEEFLVSSMYSRKQLEEELKKISGGTQFERLSKDEKIAVLNELMKRRGRLANLKIAAYQSRPEMVNLLIPELGFSNTQLFPEELYVWQVQTGYSKKIDDSTGYSWHSTYYSDTEVEEPKRDILDIAFKPSFIVKRHRLIDVVSGEAKGSENFGFRNYRYFQDTQNPKEYVPDSIYLPDYGGKDEKEKPSNDKPILPVLRNILERYPQTSFFKIPKPLLNLNNDFSPINNSSEFLQQYVSNINSFFINSTNVQFEKEYISELSSNNIFSEEVLAFAESVSNELTNLIYVYDHEEDEEVA